MQKTLRMRKAHVHNVVRMISTRLGARRPNTLDCVLIGTPNPIMVGGPLSHCAYKKRNEGRLGTRHDVCHRRNLTPQTLTDLEGRAVSDGKHHCRSASTTSTPYAAVVPGQCRWRLEGLHRRSWLTPFDIYAIDYITGAPMTNTTEAFSATNLSGLGHGYPSSSSDR